jgi:uncharacterized membrane protein YukC
MKKIIKEISTDEMIEMIKGLQAELDEVKEQKQNLELHGLPETKWTIARDFLAIIGGIAIFIYIGSYISSF